MEKWLSKFGMWLHKRKCKDSKISQLTDSDRIVFECQSCGNYWGYDE